METLSAVCDEYTMDEIKRTIRICVVEKSDFMKQIDFLRKL